MPDPRAGDGERERHHEEQAAEERAVRKEVQEREERGSTDARKEDVGEGPEAQLFAEQCEGPRADEDAEPER